ncbi:MAG: lipopolysaccharide core heptose(I) kinase RfaP [Methylococcales symbiont of Iophon sp. n. MRB-2018]|nr:MAG: lipopolysaccharide core heptose(I) kinase RfaP [Methylococcales symbiont of Iophon sp. n. MRB-2018]KAF3980424.1 MAG: lipopolysaccharide core heptose(I) kinase RfaP [Methylococcales symbiont of Iophon sp. n. MRB-2018]
MNYAKVSIQIKQLKNASFEEIMQIDGDVYRNIDGRKTLRFYIDKQGFFIKQHFGIGWREILKNLFQLKLPVLGAKDEYLAINKLKLLGIDTMQIVGFSQRGINPAKLQSFLITEELDNTISLEDYCAKWINKKPDYREKLFLINKIATIVKKLHENGINHRDLYICHFLMKKNSQLEDKRQLFLIDLHRAQLRKTVPKRWLIKDLAALYFSAMNIGLTNRDFLRFIKIYRGRSLRSIFKGERLLWDKVERKASILNSMSDSKKKR